MPDLPLVTIFVGTRPEAIKLAPVIICFRKSLLIKTRVVLTGQHVEMVSQVMNIFNIKSEKNLNIMKDNQTLEDITINCIKGCGQEFKFHRPDLVIVQGDTTSAFAACLAAFYNKINIANVEAGLRTNNLLSPYPEEANRRMISQLSNLHFTPTSLTKKNLLNSSIKDNIYVTGNTAIDSLEKFLKNDFNQLNNFGIEFTQKVILLTVHRRENWGLGIKNIIKAIQLLTEQFQDIFFVIPMHKNKIIRKDFIENLEENEKVLLLDTLEYHDLLNIMKNCFLILSDSGGIQEEAPSFSKPVLVLRENTERQEAILAGTAKIIGTNTKDIVNEVISLIKNENKYKGMISKGNPFGDGFASERILKICTNFLNLSNESIDEFS